MGDILSDLFAAFEHASAGYVLLPEQQPGPSRQLDDLERLMLAVVYQAWVELPKVQAKHPSQRALGLAARDYFENRRAVWPLSFAAICAHFGWDQGWCCDRLFNRPQPPRGRTQAGTTMGIRRPRRRELGLTVSGLAPSAPELVVDLVGGLNPQQLEDQSSYPFGIVMGDG